MNRLAIVIPAYKPIFFEKTLQSIADQTCKNFTVYIGDDASTEDLYSIVNKFEGRFNFHYKRFNENLGRRSLVKHWERCLAMLEDEEWVWLFSDDDLMCETCVDLFYDALNHTSSIYHLYRFQTAVINEKGKIISVHRLPETTSAGRFLHRRLRYSHNSYAVEYIFNLQHFYAMGGFIDFPKAWCSDDATWYSLSQEKGIYTINQGIVKWRTSGENISGTLQKNTAELFDASCSYLQWLDLKISNQKSKSRPSRFLLYYWFHFQMLIIGKINNQHDLATSAKLFAELVPVRHIKFFQLMVMPYHFCLKSNLFIHKLNFSIELLKSKPAGLLSAGLT